jgi:mannose-6-phosphate isomerase-like protein (cupin superfamily)
MLENVIYDNRIIAIIIRKDYHNKDIVFFTPNDFSQQLAFMSHPKNKKIAPHVHNQVKREVHLTKEVLFIRKGKIRVDFYNDRKEYLESRVLTDGDVVLLASGGHGFTMLEDTEMFEVKQGPYAGDNDKTRFEGIKETNVRIADEEQ